MVQYKPQTKTWNKNTNFNLKKFNQAISLENSLTNLTKKVIYAQNWYVNGFNAITLFVCCHQALHIFLDIFYEQKVFLMWWFSVIIFILLGWIESSNWTGVCKLLDGYDNTLEKKQWGGACL